MLSVMGFVPLDDDLSDLEDEAPLTRFVFDVRESRDEYGNFKRAAVVPFSPEAMALRLRVPFDRDNVERIARELAGRGRLCVLVGRDGRVREVGLPSQR
jgi:hypothetical protein